MGEVEELQCRVQEVQEVEEVQCRVQEVEVAYSGFLKKPCRQVCSHSRRLNV